MSDFLSGNEPINRAELVAITGFPAEVADRLGCGDKLTLRTALRLAVFEEACMTAPAFATAIAACAATEAEAGGKQILAVNWLNGTPSAGWVNMVSNDLCRTTLLVPAEHLFTGLAKRLIAHRASVARPN